MNSSGAYYLLHLAADSWQLLSANVDQQNLTQEFVPDKLIEQASSIAESLKEAGQEGEPIVLGLDASWCLAATIDIPSPKMLRNPQLLHNQLEEWIPWSAEDYVSDFLGHRSQAFSMAVRHHALAGFLHSLEELGVRIVAIVPTLLLAVADHLTDPDLPADHLLLWHEGEAVDVFTVRQGQPLKWSHLPVADVQRELQLELLTQPDTGPCYTRNLVQELNNSVKLPELEQGLAASKASQEILAGRQEPLLDLRRGELAGRERHQVLGRETRRLKIATALLLICIVLGFWERSEQYQQVTADCNTQLAKTYQELFPTSKIPERVGAAIEKEFQLLRGTRAPTTDLPSPVAADALLERLLQHLPEDLRFRLPEIRIEQERITLGGEVRSNADADQIATALRSHRFTVDPPRTQRLADKGFSARWQAKVEAESNE